MSRTSIHFRTNRSRRIASWAVKPWRRSSLFSPVSAFSRLPKRPIPTNAQGWDYDATGNWDSVTTNSVTQTRGANRQNEITSVSGATTPTYDNNGNLTKDENDYRFVWDAWNREVKIKNSSNTVIATNAFDGLNRKVQVTTSAGLIDKIFGKDWQVFEDKYGSNTLNRYVWSPAYVDGLVIRDRDTDANGTLDERLFALQDANWNVTGITNTSGTIQERYTYSPFGMVTIRDFSGFVKSLSAKNWVILYQGAQADILFDYEFRHRIHSASLGRWLSGDPIESDSNLYIFNLNNPGDLTDPLGLLACKPDKIINGYTTPLKGYEISWKGYVIKIEGREAVMPIPVSTCPICCKDRSRGEITRMHITYMVEGMGAGTRRWAIRDLFPNAGSIFNKFGFVSPIGAGVGLTLAAKLSGKIEGDFEFSTCPNNGDEPKNKICGYVNLTLGAGGGSTFTILRNTLVVWFGGAISIPIKVCLGKSADSPNISGGMSESTPNFNQASGSIQAGFYIYDNTNLKYVYGEKACIFGCK